MPNLNVKGETSKPSSSASHAGGGGSKVFMILIVVVIGLAALAFILNKTGVVKLWGKKKSQVVQIDVPPSLPPVTQDTTTGVEALPEQAVEAKPDENITKLEVGAKSENKKVKASPKKNVVTGTGMYTIQISSWPSETKASSLAQIFSDAGFEAFVEPMGGYFRVCIGRYESKNDAKTQAAKIEHMLETSYVIAKLGK